MAQENHWLPGFNFNVEEWDAPVAGIAPELIRVWRLANSRMREIVRAVLFVSALMLGATNADAQGTMPDHVFEAWPPVPPLNEQSVAHYCIHRNLLYSTGAVLCEGGQGLVCAPGATGEQAYWSSVPVNRGGVDWTPPAHCGK